MKTFQAIANYQTGGYPLEFYQGITQIETNLHDDATEELNKRAKKIKSQKIMDAPRKCPYN